MEYTEWFDRTTSGETLRQVAKRADVPLATLSSQTRKGTLKADSIIKIAEAYDESPVIALVDHRSHFRGWLWPAVFVFVHVTTISWC